MLASPDLDTIVLLDFEYTPACEGETHAEGKYGHNPTEDARWVMTTSCCGPKLLVCDSRRAHIRAQNGVFCAKHQQQHTADDIIFTPINPEAT